MATLCIGELKFARLQSIKIILLSTVYMSQATNPKGDVDLPTPTGKRREIMLYVGMQKFVLV